jgi:hypothetical protein
VRRALVGLAGGRLNVESTSYDERLFAKAASASDQSTVLFAVISALVDFLFAFNADEQRERHVLRQRQDDQQRGDQHDHADDRELWRGEQDRAGRRQT